MTLLKAPDGIRSQYTSRLREHSSNARLAPQVHNQHMNKLLSAPAYIQPARHRHCKQPRIHAHSSARMLGAALASQAGPHSLLAGRRPRGT